MIDNPANTQLDICCLPLAGLLEGSDFATVPMLVVKPASTRKYEDEEELYTSFEEAISERAARVSRQLERLSTSGSLPALASAPSVNTVSPKMLRCPRFWRARRAITLACLGLSLLLAGFDLMGLLVLGR